MFIEKPYSAIGQKDPAPAAVVKRLDLFECGQAIRGTVVEDLAQDFLIYASLHQSRLHCPVGNLLGALIYAQAIEMAARRAAGEDIGQRGMAGRFALQRGAVDGARMSTADSAAEAGQWMSYSRTWDEQRFSPLDQINEGNVSRLGLAWYDDLNTYRGVQSTPLYVDGVLYNASVWNVVTAYDARNGRVLWRFDPKVDRQWARLACCGPTTRGIALWKGRVYIGALDGRLIAVNARSGRQVWSVQTLDTTQPYSITGPPRVFDGRVVVGNGGADYGVRGYVTAYDAETGRYRTNYGLILEIVGGLGFLLTMLVFFVGEARKRRRGPLA